MRLIGAGNAACCVLRAAPAMVRLRSCACVCVCRWEDLTAPRYDFVLNLVKAWAHGGGTRRHTTRDAPPP